MHAQTRSKKLVNQLYELGLSVSYQRVNDIMNNLTTSVCDHFKSAGVVWPLSLQSGLFTIGTIDHDPSSTTAQGSFHGTGISLYQFPKQASDVSQPAVQKVNLCSTRSASRDITLPDKYSSVLPVSMKTSEVKVPATSQGGVETLSTDQLSIAIEKQVHWLKHCEHHLNKELTKGVFLSWAAHHASVTELPSPLPCLSSLLPLFYEKAATVAMMKHGMFVIKEAWNFVIQAKLLSPSVISLFLPLQKLFSGTGLLHTEKIFTLSCWEAYTLRWFCGPCAVTYRLHLAGRQH